MKYQIATDFPLAIGFDRLETAVREILEAHGFGVLTEIDVQHILKKKLDVDRPSYKILGACNPPRANMALNNEPDIGLLLPCNVIIYETEDGKLRVATTKANSLFQLVDNPAVGSVAEEVDGIMNQVIKDLQEKFSN